MSIGRRELFNAGAFALLLGGSAAAQTTPAASAAKPSALDRVNAAARGGWQPLVRAGDAFSGPGWDLLVREGREAQFVLLGEEHGAAEIPVLSSALFQALQPAGYDRVAIEISPPMATALDAQARGGMPALKRFLAEPANAVAFYTLEPEAAFLAGVRAAVPGSAPVLWGLDYDIGADRRLIAELGRRAPVIARPSVQRLADASHASWAEYERTRNPGKIFSFGGDPELVAAVRRAWVRPDAQARLLMDTLEETLRINADQVGGRYWQANDRRARFNRSNLVKHLRAERDARVLFKFGANHMIRGRNLTGVYDIGNLAAEAAELNDARSFHLLVILGTGSQRAQFDPTVYGYKPRPVDNLPEFGLQGMAPGAGGGHAVLDLRPLRPLAGRTVEAGAPELARVIHGFDAVVVLDRAAASAPLTAV